MVIQKIAQEIIKYAIRSRPITGRLVNSEKLALNYAWKGFKHKSSIVGGIRTGLLGGAVAGTQLNTADVPEVYTPPIRITPPYQQNKTRNRRRGVCRRYTSYNGRSYTRCRQRRNVKSYSNRNRKYR